MPPSLELPGLFTSQVFVITDHAPFSTRQFAGPTALFVMLYFIAAAAGKWVLCLGRCHLSACVLIGLLLGGRLRASS